LGTGLKLKEVWSVGVMGIKIREIPKIKPQIKNKFQ
jgi:hypothetical protein